MTINSKTLKVILQQASMFVASHATLPVLTTFRLVKDSKNLIIHATDMEKYFSNIHTDATEEEFDICVDAKLFNDIINQLDWDITLTVGKLLTITCGTDKFELTTIPWSEYVATPKVEWVVVELDAIELNRGIDSVLSCIQEKNFSPIMTGMLIKRKAWELIFAGTDSFHLGEYKLNSDGEDFWIVIPKIHLNSINKILRQYDKVTATISNSMIHFTDGVTSCQTLLIQGNYPDYNNENIMPRQWNASVKCDAKSLANAIKKCTIFSKEVNNYVKLTVKDNTMSLTSQEDTKWKTETKIECKGDNMEISFNGKYFIDFCAKSNGEIEINIVDNVKPITLKNDINWFTTIIRPLIK